MGDRRKTNHGNHLWITSLTAEQADEHRLLSLNRGHWAIENKLHLPRDTTYREDHCRIRKHQGAHVMGVLRNLAISLHALRAVPMDKKRCTTIPKMNRHLARNPQKAINFCITPLINNLLQKTE